MLMRPLGFMQAKATGSEWTPADLFAASEAGWWHEPHPDNCFQNSDGTVACAVGDPVGYMVDLSGNGNHATTTISAQRPVLGQEATGEYYLEFDGVDDELFVNGSGNPSISAGPQTIAYAASATNNQYVIDISVGRMVFTGPRASDGETEFYNGTKWTTTTALGANSGATVVVRAASSWTMRINGVERLAGSMTERGASGTVSYGGKATGGGFELEGKAYAYIFREGDTTGDHLTNLEAHLDGLRP